jgi:serine phosphatase RsbU (regulator of sigma subunit)
LKSDIDDRGAKSILGYKDDYSVNEISLMGGGDIMVLYTDGLSELREGSTAFLPDILESRLRELKDLPAKEICQALIEQVQGLPRDDDISLVVIKRQ